MKCSDARRKTMREYYQTHKAQVIETVKRWTKSHPEKRKIIQARYNAKRKARRAAKRESLQAIEQTFN
jgi:hypothetical protein